MERTNATWLMALQGAERDVALADLRALLVRGLGYALAGHGVTEADVEDFAQEALLKILEGLSSFRGESRFITWAQKVAVRVAFTELRRRRWQDVSLQDVLSQYEGDFTPAFLGDPAPSPERQTTQRALVEIVQKAIAEGLSERQREALLATVLAGMSMTEVARRLNTNRNALYKMVYDARQRLRQELLASGLSPEEILAAFEA